MLYEQMKLGENIVLSGFEKVDSDTLFIVKKIVGNYVKDYAAQNPSFRYLHIYLDVNEGYNVVATITDPPNNAKVKDNNLVSALGSALNNIGNIGEVA